ncbi:AGE family epimerase/isomerase [Demequina sediminicola]|uniref:AGE family epimerase/isomerase n=1 Tax=Demequina sediminicola TaxID=1095026 RepID=UPI00191C54BB|nr:AGE family epimerase/isomerase [Demequina sediminicola]
MSDAPGSAEYLTQQRASLVPWVAMARNEHGFGYLNADGSLDASKGTELWITCRMTHVAALGLLAQEEPHNSGPSASELRDLATHGVRCLAETFHDGANGGWYAAVGADGPTVTTKQAYGHAFVILAASSALAAGVDGADELLTAALKVSDERFWDEEHGLVVEEWNADWSELDSYRGVNANMHTVEAYLAAGDVLGERRWHLRAGRIGEHVVAWAKSNNWRIPEHFDSSWEPQLELHREQPAHPFRPYGATVGHGLEWARLLLAIDQSLGADAPEGFEVAATALYEQAVADGWDADGAVGFVYTTDWEGTPVVRDRMHWVVAEATATAAALEKTTGEPQYSDAAAHWWQYADECVIDHEGGSWFHELDPQNRPAGTVWPGKPDVYHAYQAALLPELPLTPSFAAALRARGGV